MVNQRLAVRTLERHGHTVVVADNGIEALAALERETFDLILTDVQMPEMDGFELTAAIREQEQSTDGHITIIAMTAHAMKGDRERRLAAGMDGYISKPVQVQELLAAIVSLAPAHVRPVDKAQGDGAAPAAPGRAVEAEPAEPVFDRDVALDRVEGDLELLQEIVGIFFEETPALLGQIKAAIANRDARALERAAHTLKGSVGTCGARAAAAAALRLEMMGRGGGQGQALPLQDAEAAYAELEREIGRLEPALAALREEGTAAMRPEQ